MIFLQTATALMYDAVYVFAKALDQLDQSQVREREMYQSNENI